LNGANVGTNSATYTNAALTTGAVVTVVMTANNVCQSSATANGNAITTTVNTSLTPAVAISSNDADNSICSGTSVTFTATPTNGGTTPAYQWKLNGANVGTNSTTYTNAALTTGAVVTVVMTANNACQTSATANGNSITTAVTTPTTWYLDADADGYYVSAQTSCASPGAGYTSAAGILGDCNDNAAAVHTGAVEICGNGIDEDCSGSDLPCTSIPGCTNPAACNFNIAATVDNGSCILPQPETCNGLDDNCNGQTDEGLLSMTGLTLANVSTALYPTCSTGNISNANLNTGTDSPYISGTGPDLWYKFTAGYNTLRAGLSAATGNNTLYLFEDLGTCFNSITSVNLANSGGNQTLMSDVLVPGHSYVVALHGESGPYNASAKMCFNHLVASTCDHTYSNNTGVYSSSCLSFKAQFKSNAMAYMFEVNSATQNGSNLSINPWTYTTTSTSSVVTRIGRIFPSNLSTSPIVYSLTIPVIYSIPDPVGNMFSLTARGGASCTVTMSPEASVVLRSADRCPAMKSLTSYLTVDHTICAAEKYEWEITQVLPTSGAAVLVMGPLNSSILFVNTIPGIANGRTYNVRVRPVYYNGVKGDWGTAQCMMTTTSGMVMEGNAATTATKLDTANGFTIYPNPTSSNVIQLVWENQNDIPTEIKIMDMSGKVVFKFKNNVSGNVAVLNLGDHLSSGIYMVQAGNTYQRLVICQ
jgi:hypothetical protein